MREILFKAKRTDNGEWVEGYLFRKYYQELPHDRLVIQYKTMGNEYEWTPKYMVAEIDEKTICQHTGLTDKKGNKIWENDVIGYWDTYNTENGLAEADCIGKVLWDEETLSFQVTERLSAESYEVMDECSVIGNIFDNHELLSN